MYCGLGPKRELRDIRDIRGHQEKKVTIILSEQKRREDKMQKS